MSTFVLHLQGATQYERIEGVERFVGADVSGSFGILAHHGRFMTSLLFGLARYRTGSEPWQYLALPGALLYFADNALTLTTRRYFRDPDYSRISQVLLEELVKEEEALYEVKQSLRRLEEEMLKRLWRMGQGERPMP